MPLEIMRIDTAGMTPEQLYNAMDQKLVNLVQQLNMKLLFFQDQDTNIIETRKTILTIEQAQSEFEQVITNNIAAIDGNIYKIHGDLADYKKVVAGELTAVDGYISTLRGDFADYKVIVTDNFTASTGRIDKLSGDFAEYQVIVAGDIKAVTGKIDTISGDLADYKKIVAGNIDAITGNFENLKTKALTAEKADLLYASIGDFDAVSGRVGTLEGNFLSFKEGDFSHLTADVANIQTLIFGSATGNIITSDFSNTVVAHIGEAQIQSAMIKELAFDKLTGIDINTTNLNIHSEDGRSQWFDNTIQIADANRTRVQIGKDGTGDYSLSAWDSDGNLMFDARGIKAEAIKDSIIRNDMVANNANISAGKLDITSVFKEINDSTETIKSNRIYLDDKNQTLNVAFKAVSEKVTDQGSTLTSYGTQLSTIQGQISSKIWQQDISKAVDAAQTAMSTKYSNLEQSLEGFKISVGETYSTKTEASEVLGVANQALSASQTNAEDLSGFIKLTNSGFEELQGQIDGSIMTWFYAYVPANSNIPAKDWTSTELKNNHLGDLFYDTITGYCYRWQVLNNVYSWQRITDVDVTKALNDAAKAIDTADSKRRVFITTPIPPYDIGDLWTQGTEGELMRCKVAKTENQSYNGTDWAKATKYTDDTTANKAINDLRTTNTKVSEITTDIGKITARVSDTETSLSEVNGNITALSSRVSAAELKIEPDKIISAVYNTSSVSAINEATKMSGVELFPQSYRGDTNALPFLKTEAAPYSIVSAAEAGGSANESNLIKTNNTTTNYWLFTDYIECNVDNPFFWRMDVYYKDTIDGTVYAQVLFYDKDKTAVATNDAAINMISGASIKAANTWQALEGISSVPSYTDVRRKAKYVRVRYCSRYMGKTGVAYIRNVHFKQLAANQSEQIHNVKTTAEQTAEKFTWIVKSGTSATNFTLTDKVASLLAHQFNIDALTTFKNSAETGSQTVINGGAIKADTLTLGAFNPNDKVVEGVTAIFGDADDETSESILTQISNVNDILYGHEADSEASVEASEGLIENIDALGTDVDNAIKNYDSQFTTVNTNLNSLSTATNKLDTTVGEVKSKTDAIAQKTQWLTFDGGGLTIGASNNPFRTLITNTQLTFTNDGNPVAWINGQLFNINSGYIGEELRIGNFLLSNNEKMLNIDYSPK